MIIVQEFDIFGKPSDLLPNSATDLIDVILRHVRLPAKHLSFPVSQQPAIFRHSDGDVKGDDILVGMLMESYDIY